MSSAHAPSVQLALVEVPKLILLTLALSLVLNQTNAPYLLGGRVSKNEDARAGRSALHCSQLTMLGSFPGLSRDTPAPSPRSWRVRKVDARKTGR